MGLLRIFLALAVVCAHTTLGFQFTGGRVAVQTFFMISGFYIALILDTGYKNRFLFWSNRLLRLLPVYYLVAILTLLSVSFFGASIYGRIDGFDDLPISAKVFLVFTNSTLAFQDLTMFLGVNNGQFGFVENFYESTPPLFHFLLVPQAWSLGIEISFYLLAPALCKWPTVRLLVLIFCGVILRLLLYFAGLKNDPWNYRFFPTELVFFLCGVIAYRFYKQKNDWIRSLSHNFRLIIVGSVWISTAIFAHLPVSKGVLMLFYFALVCLTLPIIFETSRNWKVDRILGELSYPIYICHVLVISLLEMVWVGERGFAFGLGACAFSVVFAAILYFSVDQPIGLLRAKRKAELSA
jgi:peptidoglycan/LPS O-acetylase OafA/YrhL